MRALLDVDGSPLFSATDIASSLGYARPQVFLRSRELQEHMRVVGVEPYFNEVGVRAAATACPKGKNNLAAALTLWIVDEVARALQ